MLFVSGCAKRLYASTLAALSVFMFGAMGLLADDGASGLDYDMLVSIQAAVADVQAQVSLLFGVVVPVVLSITAISVAIRLGLRLLKRMLDSGD